MEFKVIIKLIKQIKQFKLLKTNQIKPLIKLV